MTFAIGTSVIYNGKFATVTGRDNGAEMAIIEFCDPYDGRFVAVRDAELIIDQASVDEEAEFQAYLDSQSNPALLAMELAGDRGPVPYSAEAFDEMARHDAEGRS